MMGEKSVAHAIRHRGYRMVRSTLNTRFPQGVISSPSRHGALAGVEVQVDQLTEVLMVAAPVLPKRTSQ